MVIGTWLVWAWKRKADSFVADKAEPAMLRTYGK